MLKERFLLMERVVGDLKRRVLLPEHINGVAKEATRDNNDGGNNGENKNAGDVVVECSDERSDAAMAEPLLHLSCV